MYPFFLSLVLFRAVDETLCRVSASKLALRALSQNTPVQAVKSVALKKTDGDLESRVQEPGVNVSVVAGVSVSVGASVGLPLGLGVGSPAPRRRSRSRGGSFGQQVQSTMNNSVTLLSLFLFLLNICFYSHLVRPNSDDFYFMT